MPGDRCAPPPHTPAGAVCVLHRENDLLAKTGQTTEAEWDGETGWHSIYQRAWVGSERAWTNGWRFVRVCGESGDA